MSIQLVNEYMNDVKNTLIDNYKMNADVAVKLLEGFEKQALEDENFIFHYSPEYWADKLNNLMEYQKLQ